MSFKKIDTIKCYFNLYFAKSFIKASLVFYSVSVLFVKKSSCKIWFYINY